MVLKIVMFFLTTVNFNGKLVSCYPPIEKIQDAL